MALLEKTIQDGGNEAEVHVSDPPAFKDTLTKLSQPLPKDKIKTRPGGENRDGSKNNYEYAAWYTVADILDDQAPSWSHSIKDIQILGAFVAVTVAITIDGITREGVGTGTVAKEDGIKKAEHDALKRAAVKFGIARGLYRKESDDTDRRAGSYRSEFDINNPPLNARAQTRQEKISDKQFNMIKLLSREVGIDDFNEDCQAHLKCNVAELNKSSASWFISYLQHLQNGIEQGENAIRSNVAKFPSERSSKPQVSTETKAKDLLEAGAVEELEDGSYNVRDIVAGKEITFHVVEDGGVLTCGCGEYKTAANIQGDVEYLCPHKAAAGLFENFSGSVA